MRSIADDVRDFHEKFRQTYSGPPRRLPEDVLAFRLAFQREELQELLTASGMADTTGLTHKLTRVGEQSPADQLDALVDIVYVALGTAYLAGWNFDEAWRLVHEKNMQKTPPAPGKFKITKPPGWTPPDLSDLVP